MGMKRLIIAALLVAASVPATVAVGSTPRASLRAFECQTARDPAGRGVAITAVIRPLAQTTSMAIRFDLLVADKRGGAAAPLVYGDLGKWKYAPTALTKQTNDQYVLHKPVSGLNVAPAYYHFKVSFRWTGAHGRVLGTAARDSPVCFQPELRPDLRVAWIRVKADPKNARKDIYATQIRNAGASAAGQFLVQFSDGRSPPPTKKVLQLGSHDKINLMFLGPLCNVSAPPTITVDPTQQVDDFNRSNNSLTAACPAG